MEHLPSKIPKFFSNLLLSSASSHRDRTTGPHEGVDFSAGMEKRAAIPSVVHSTKLPTRKFTERSRAIEPAMNVKSRTFSSGISESHSSGIRRTSLIPQPEQAQAAAIISNPSVSPKVASKLQPGPRTSAPKTELLHDFAQIRRQQHELPTPSPIHVHPPSKPTNPSSLSRTRISDRGKIRGSSPNSVRYLPSQKPPPQTGNKRNSGDSNSSMPSNGRKRGSAGVTSGTVLSGGVRQQQGPTGAADRLKGSYGLAQSHKKLLQTAGLINSSNVRYVDPTRDAVTPSGLSDSITSAVSVEMPTDSSTPTGFSSAIDDVGHGLRGGSLAPIDVYRDEEIYICHQQSDVYQAQLGIMSAHQRVDRTTSSIGENSKETWSLKSRSNTPRSTRHSLGVAGPLVFNEDASPVPHASRLDPSTFESDRLEVPGVISRATKAPLGGDCVRLGEAEQLCDANNGTSLERDKILSPTLESLMDIHNPLNLSNEVFIPDYQKVAHGGIAIVYAGIWRDRQVAVKVLRVRKSRNADWDASNERRLRREMNVWAALEHPNISEFLGYSAGFSDFPAMISHWCSRGTALEYLESQDLPVGERVKLAQDVCGGLQYLHHLKIIHGDLKPSNVLVDSDYVAKLCDFGLVRLADWNGPHGMTTTSPYMGTERYKAPELFISADNRHPRATFEGDIYSLGCLMVEFIEQIYPFQRFMKAHQLRRAIMDGYSPALRSETAHALNDMTHFFWNLLEACWGEPPSRPPIDVIVDALGDFTKATPDPA